ncbi:MAG: DUF2637 domain-containing protein [Pseudonocardiaceae bacterium]|nr:DUF2637 domain-containing protein [Pseudonocardiaceae bacterium]
MTGPQTAPSPAVRVVTVAAVLLVAIVAAVVSYAHMQDVAQRSGEAWRSYLLPLSVDGLMVAASMVLLTRRRAGLPGGALAWSALLAGVGASLAANVAAAEPTAMARVVAAWPAVAFAVAFELLLMQRRARVDERAGEPATDVTDRQQTTAVPESGTTAVPQWRSADVPDPGPAPIVAARPVAAPTRPAPARWAASPARPAPGPAGGPDVSDLAPAGRAVAARLAREGRSLSRAALLDGLHADGHTCSKARASALLALLRAGTGSAEQQRPGPRPVRDVA